MSIRSTRGKSVLDLVLCNNPDRICSIEIIEPLGTSNHSAVRF
uniref:Endonuclease/exonuclease/phosphatase domain-containing protein n=1 Tax=Anguilla anguilla TaxID=7936 RepID=A0A0E9U3G2_ANGAN